MIESREEYRERVRVEEMRPEELRAYVRTVLSTPPERIYPMRAWEGPLDARWPDQHAQRDTYGEWGRARGYVVKAWPKGGLYFEGASQCNPLECQGVLLYRWGPDGRYAKEVPCPVHYQERYAAPPDMAKMFATEVNQKRAALLQAAEIPRFYSDFHLEDWPGPPRTRERALDWARNPLRGQGLLIMGPYGVGKTSLAKGLLEERITRYGDTGLFLHTADMMDRLRYGVDMDETLLGRIKGVGVLVLDDLGAERTQTEWQQEQIWKIISYRHDNLRSTIVTTNLPSSLIWEHRFNRSVPARDETGALVQTLEEKYGRRTVERFLDEEAFDVITVNTEDLRLA